MRTIWGGGLSVIALREKFLYLEFFSYFLAFRLPLPIQMRENTDQKNSEYSYFSRSVIYTMFQLFSFSFKSIEDYFFC